MLGILLILIFSRPLIASLAFPYLNGAHAIFLFLSLCIWFAVKKPPLLRNKRLFYPVLALCLALALSFLFSGNRMNSLKEIYKYPLGLALFVATAHFDAGETKAVLKTLACGGVVIGILALEQYFFGFRNLLHYLKDTGVAGSFALDYIARHRAFSPFVTPNTLGGYLAMVAPLVLVLRYKKTALAIILVAIFLTGSLGAMVSLLAGTFYYFYLKGFWSKKNIAYLMTAFLAIAAVFAWRTVTQPHYGQPGFSATMRWNYWLETLTIIKTHPLAGAGVGNFNLTYARYAHNSYLQFLAETGIFGLSALLWLIGAAWRPDAGNPPSQKYRPLILTAVLVFLTHNLVDFSFFLPEVSLIWWLLLGMAGGVPAVEPENLLR